MAAPGARLTAPLSVPVARAARAQDPAGRCVRPAGRWGAAALGCPAPTVVSGRGALRWAPPDSAQCHSGFGADAATSGGGKTSGTIPNGPCDRSTPAQGIGLPGRGNSSGGGAYEHGEPGATAGPG